MNRRTFFKTLACGTVAAVGTPILLDKFTSPDNPKQVIRKTTALVATDALQMMSRLESDIKKICEQYVFERNEEETRESIKKNINGYLERYESNRRVHGFIVVCDGTNNTPEMMDNNEIQTDIYYYPNREERKNGPTPVILKHLNVIISGDLNGLRYIEDRDSIV